MPRGLGGLSAPLAGLVDFFRIDKDLVAAAAAASQRIADVEPTRAQMKRWVARLPGEEKDDLLSRLMAGEGAIANELVRPMRHGEDAGIAEAGESGRRTAGELLTLAPDRTAQRRRGEAEAAAKAKAQRERAAAAARTRYLDGLVGREPAIWKQVNNLIATRQPSSYDEAVRLVIPAGAERARRWHGLHATARGAAWRARAEALIDRPPGQEGTGIVAARVAPRWEFKVSCAARNSVCRVKWP